MPLWGRNFAELMAAPGRSESFLDSFFRETGINIDWTLDEAVWRAAGRALQTYAARRRKQRDPGPRRILADFVIGAHALEAGYRLLTLDDHLYRPLSPSVLS
jgi:predicted nucleic acid-binding protein